MNYLKELSAFREWLLLNNLPAGAISLWHTLMSINNAARWKKRFNAPNGVVQQLSGLSKQGLQDAREKLKANNLITFEKGKRGQASVYEMISLTDAPVAEADESPDEYALQLPDQYTYQSPDQSGNQLQSESRDESTYPSLDQSADQSVSLFPDESVDQPQAESRPVRKQKQKETQERRRGDTRVNVLFTTYEQNIGK